MTKTRMLVFATLLTIGSVIALGIAGCSGSGMDSMGGMSCCKDGGSSAQSCHSSSAAQASPSAAPQVYANSRCPIMGSNIDPARVPANLVREYKGRRIAFCCGGCPGQWDKLTDAQKDAKLAAIGR